MHKILRFPSFLLLIGFFPILFLLENNLGQVSILDSGPSTIISIVISLIISISCFLLFHPLSRAYVISLLINGAFFSYGHLFNLFDARTIGGLLVGRHLLFLPVFTLVVIFLIIIITKIAAPNEYKVLVFSNVLVIGLCLIQIAGIGFYSLSAYSQMITAEKEVEEKELNSSESGPDIYYIILDGLAREDVIRDKFGEVLYSLPEELQRRGFFIPNCAYSNYGGTAVSLSSSLNMNYLNDLGLPDYQVNTTENDPAVLYNLLHKNLVTVELQRKGYKFVAFRGFFPLNDFQEADYYYSFSKDQQGHDVLAERSFREMFIRTTLLRVLSEWFEGSPEKFSFVPRFLAEIISPEARQFSSRSYQWYREHLFTFDKLQTIPSLPGKKFVYAHFYTTHQPYVFDQDGELLWPINEDNNGYIYAVQFTERRILEVIDQILLDSKQPPVVIIQADHGIGLDLDKYKILNAYYLPDGGNQFLYDTITPVNTFRLVLNQIDGEKYKLLPDIIMSSQVGREEFTPLTVTCDLGK